MTEKIRQLAKVWGESCSAVVITGAGVSTSSGLGDFTGDNATYKGVPVKEILSRKFMLEHTALFNEYCRNKLYAPYATPNIVHKTLAKWEESGLVNLVLTQNIDCLHRVAGTKEILELHGNMARVYCDNCKITVSSPSIYGVSRILNKCTKCGGSLRPSIVLYGEELNPQLMAKAREHLNEAPLVVVMGTRLGTLGPVELLSEYIRAGGGRVVYIGDEEPEMSGFDLIVLGNLEEIFSELTKYLV